ncbi:hypothetical protein K6T82_16465 [Flavobacterium sp. 17A]|uniref:Collagen triple helix repeat-containing protein n=1 Tax=Flavobacterium potami TaxID=2872310 RepID=A0A9X1KSL1_9FLAO|nr:hypothetical protein [Flavobacterium potami]MBZ4036366.1 hypothetical protein [Flavobacterium potami]
MKTFKTIFFILLISISTIACSSDDGTDGVDGAVGPAGPAGSANVIYSAWINAPAGTPETIDGTSGLSTSFAVPQLTADIMAKGTVLVYMSFGSGTNVYTLPYTSTAGGSVNTITPIASLNTIKIFRFKHANDGTTVALPASLNYRYILIPGGATAATSKTTKVDYSKMSYEEVCDRLNIQP